MESERETRRTRIDPRLKASGWNVAPFAGPDPALYPKPTAVEEYETANGPADYALATDDRIVGVVEAKKVTLGPQGVLVQAERYSKAIEQDPRYQGEFGGPFLCSIDGEETRFHDFRQAMNRCRKVSEF